MEICLLSIGKISNSWIQTGVTEFERRLSKYIKFSFNVLPDIKNAKTLTSSQIKIEEGKLIQNALNPIDYVVLLDERGKEFTSSEFSKRLEKIMTSGRKRIVFVIGGPYGFSESVYMRADSKLSLSKMTFTHEMAKLFFTEQLYRAFTILNHEPYHHE